MPGISNFASTHRDLVSIALYVALLIVGWLLQYSTAGGETISEIFQFEQVQFAKHSVWVLGALFIFWLIQFIPRRIWGSLSWIFYVLSLLLLFLVLLMGSDVKGAQSWIKLGGLSVQPSELAKLSTFLVLSTFLSNISVNVTTNYNRVVANTIILIPLLLILLQPDAGSALVFLASFLVLFREGYSPLPLYFAVSLAFIFILTIKFSVVLVLLLLVVLYDIILLNKARQAENIFLIYTVFVACSLVAAYYGFAQLMLYIHLVIALVGTAYLAFRQKESLFVIIMVAGLAFYALVSTSIEYMFRNILKPHQQERILVWLDPSSGDPRGSLYNVLQSKMAIGSGQMTGKGYLEAYMTKLDYIPEQNTDFVFSALSEQFGFIGASFVLMLFLFLLLRLLYLAEKQKSRFSRIFMLCVACCFFTHLFINVGMTMGLVPVIGIPLPFLSYGGTAMMSFSIMLAICVAIDDSRETAHEI